MTQVAKFFSYVLHPMLMPTYMLVFLLNANSFYLLPVPTMLTKYLFALIIIFTIVLPVLFSVYLKKNGVIQSLTMNTNDERKAPFLFTAGCYFAVYYVLAKTQLTLVLNIMMLGAVISLLLLILFNYKTKISAHMVGIGGCLGTLLCLQFFLNINLLYSIIFCILLCGIAGTGRLILNAHTHAQIYLGLLVGLSGQFAIFSALKYFVH